MNSEPNRLALYLGLVLVVMVAEGVVGWWTGSLALVADAIHMFSDALSVLIGLFSRWATGQKRSKYFPWGLVLADALAGFANGVFLLVVAWSIATEALFRLATGVPSLGESWGVVLWTTGLGLGANLFGLYWFHDIAHGSTPSGGVFVQDPCCEPSERGNAGSVAVRSVALHLFADASASVAVLASVVFRIAFGWDWVDPVASLLVSMVLFFTTYPLLMETSQLLIAPHPPKAEKAMGFGTSIRWWPVSTVAGGRWQAMVHTTSPPEGINATKRAVSSVLRSSGAQLTVIHVDPTESPPQNPILSDLI